MSSFSEYGRLRTIMLGTVQDYQPACWAWKTHEIDLKDNFAKAIEICNSAIPREIYDEVEEDLDLFQKVLEKYDVEVLRPPTFNTNPVLETDFYYSYGRDFYNLRDLHIVLGNQILSAAPSQPNRILEIQNIKEYVSSIAKKKNLEFIHSPLPVLTKNPEVPFFRNEHGNLISLEEQLSANLGSITPEIWHRLAEEEILFDAANLMRFDSEAIYLISSTGNRLSFEWLKKNIKSFQMEATDVYRSSHLDSTILPLNSKTVLVNSVRVNKNNIPQTLKDKHILYFSNVAGIPLSETIFHKKFREPAAMKLESLHFNTNLKEMSSPWAGMNILSIDEKTVLVESNQVALATFLESEGFAVEMVRLRHPYTMLGGLHCTTLDLVRDKS